MKKIELTIIETARRMQSEADASVFNRRIRVLSCRDTLHMNAGSVFLYLHGSAVAYTERKEDGGLEVVLSSCGFTSRTTKSRINAMLAAFNCPGHVVQKGWCWYIRTDGKDEPFHDGMRLAVPVLEGEK